MYGLLKLVVHTLLPFSTVCNAVIRESVRFRSISLGSFMKYLGKMTRHVEHKIQNELSNKFALIFDGWSENQTHFIALYASYPSTNEKKYDLRLLGFSH